MFENSSPGGFDKAAHGRFMRNWPAKIDLDVDDLSVEQCNDFRVTRRLSGRPSQLISDEDPLAVGKDNLRIRSHSGRYSPTPNVSRTAWPLRRDVHDVPDAEVFFHTVCR